MPQFGAEGMKADDPLRAYGKAKLSYRQFCWSMLMRKPQHQWCVQILRRSAAPTTGWGYSPRALRERYMRLGEPTAYGKSNMAPLMRGYFRTHFSLRLVDSHLLT